MNSAAYDLPSYTGVMICSRPEDTVKLKREIPFLSRVAKTENVGINPIRRFPDEVSKRSRHPVLVQPHATTNHKRWIQNLDYEMQIRAEEAYENDVEREKLFNRFREKSKANRQKWRAFKEEYSGIQKSTISKSVANLTKASCTPIDYDKLIDDVLYSENYLEATQVRRPEIIAKRKKPAWAKTEKENQIDEEEQIDDLVDFMDNFDPKSYIEDVKVKSLIENIMERVEQVKDSTSTKKPFKSPSVRFSTNFHIRPHSRHEIKHNDCNSGANPFTKQPSKTIKRPATAAAIKQLQHNDQSRLKTKIIKHIADNIIKQDKNIAIVHSNASIRRLIEHLVADYFAYNGQVLDRYVSPSWKQTEISKPKVVSYKRDRIETKNTAQNLPYLYPSPLI